MNNRNKIAERQDKEKEKESSQPASREDCRCKEASHMSPGQLLKLMISDLAFWKKADKE